MGRLPVIRRMAVLFAAVVLGLGSAAAPAWAHEALVASEPAAEAALVAAPPYVRLTFSGNVRGCRSHGGAAGQRRRRRAGRRAASSSGPTVTLPIEQQLANGSYAVEWRIVSSDGDPVSGTFAFTVAAPVVACAGAADRPSARPVRAASNPARRW